MKINGRAIALGGGVLGIAATATAVALRRRHVKADDPLRDEPLGALAPDRAYTVAADDGTPLSVEEVDPAQGRPELTAVFVHGLALSRRSWHFQRRDLAALDRPCVRQVFYDHRSHGRSTRGPVGTSTIDQLATDLDAVLRAAVPDGPIVLIGHSMGGMTIMALAEQRPELFAERVRGVALIATSAGEVGKRGLPRPVLSKHNPLTRRIGQLAEWQPGFVELVRSAGGQVTRRAVRLLAFGGADVSPSLVDFMVDMLDVTPVAVLADFVETLGSHNRYAALAGLKHCRVLVLSGDADRFTPFSHAERVAAELPDAHLVRVEGTGHMVMLEQHETVNEHLAELFAACVKGQGWRTWWRAKPW